MRLDFLMPIATYPDPTPKAGLRRALDLVATLTGRLTALVHEVDIPPLHNILAEIVLDVSAMAAEAEARSRERGGEIVGELKHLAEYFRLPFEAKTLRCRPEEAADRIAVAARTHDITLMVPGQQSPEQHNVAEAVIFGAGGPAILFPEHETPAHLKAVVIAWDGSRAAARAVRDALPLLAHTKDVCVATFGDDKPQAASGLAELRFLLGNHGVQTRHVEGIKGNAAIGHALQDFALAQDAGLLVMGAYGHNRMQEFILGGATRAVLRHVRLPVLMSH
ncbi:MAG: universal stress protein [Devosia sp.]